MPDFKKMTLQSLRELARKKLGPGHARLKTKAEIVAALEAGQGAEEKEEKKKAPAAARTQGARSRAAVAKAEPPGKAVRAVKEAGKAARAGVRAAVRVGKATVQGAAEGARAAKGTARAAKGGKLRKAAAVAAGAAAGARDAAKNVARPGEGLPDPEGYFVARVRGEDAVREAPHQMAETGGSDAPFQEDSEGVGTPKYDEGLGDLPWGYGDDAFVALPRDPTTLFLYWDLAGDTISRGFEGLDHGRAQLWLFVQAGTGWERLRVLEFALESRGYYLHDLEPGRTYRAEIHAIDRRGTDRLVGRASNEVRLPPIGPSPVVDDRFARIPWDVPLGRLLGPGHPGGPFSEDARALLARLSDWTRFAGSTWGSAGGMGGRPFSPTSSPGGKPGPQGGGEGR